MKWLVVLAGLVLVNFPAVHEVLVQREIAREGRLVSATVLDARSTDGSNFVDYRLPHEVDPQGTRFSAELEDKAYGAARRSDRLEVLVVPGQPSRNQPEGAVSDHLLLFVAGVADAIFLVAVVLFLVGRRRGDEDPGT